jgi:hypothetical protein
VFVEPVDIRNQQDFDMKSTELYVDEKVVEEYKNWRSADRDYLEGHWTWWKAEVDYDFQPMKRHQFYFRTIRNLLSLGMILFFIQYWGPRLNEAYISVLSSGDKPVGKWTGLTEGGQKILTMDNGLKVLVSKNGVVKQYDPED